MLAEFRTDYIQNRNLGYYCYASLLSEVQNVLSQLLNKAAETVFEMVSSGIKFADAAEVNLFGNEGQIW